MFSDVSDLPAFLFSAVLILAWAALATLFIDYVGQMFGWWDDK